MSAHGIGAVALIQPGVIVWSTKRGYAGVDSVEDDKPGEPIGGVVIKVTEQVNRETGEVERSFLVLDHTRTRPRLRFRTMLESEIDRDTVEAADLAVLRRLWRRCGEDIGARRHVATADEARVGIALYELLGLVFGDGGPLHGLLAPLRHDLKNDVPRPQAPANVSALVD